MQILLGKLKEKKLDYETQVKRKQMENEDLMDKKQNMEEQLKKFNNDITDAQYEDKLLPDQLKNLDDHLKVTEHEKRKIQIEYQKVMKEIEQMDIVRTGKNPSNPRPSGTSKNPRDKRNAAKKGLAGSRH